MRKVMVRHAVQPERIMGAVQPWRLVDKGVALFHQFGVEYGGVVHRSRQSSYLTK
jgi:hypothetical protein